MRSALLLDGAALGGREAGLEQTPHLREALGDDLRLVELVDDPLGEEAVEARPRGGWTWSWK